MHEINKFLNRNIDISHMFDTLISVHFGRSQLVVACNTMSCIERNMTGYDIILLFDQFIVVILGVK